MFGKRVKKTHGFYMEQRFIDLQSKTIFNLPIIGREFLYSDYAYKEKDSYDTSLFINDNYFIGIDKEDTNEIKNLTTPQIAKGYGLTGEILTKHNFRDHDENIYPQEPKYPDL